MTMLQKIFCCLCIICSSASYADDDSLSSYFVDVWTSHDGLPHNSISDIAQTEDGYLWFATWEGVARYNGRQFTLFDRNNDTHMQDSGSKVLTPEEGNKLWVAGARGSLVTRLGKNWRSNPSASGLINDVLIDSDKNLWIAVESLGVIFRPYLQDDQYGEDEWLLQDVSAYRLVENHEGIHAGTADGLYYLTPTTAKKIESDHFNRIAYLSVANNGDILIGSENGPWCWDGKQMHNFTTELDNQKITVIEQDSDGHFWFGTTNKGVARLSHHALEFLNVHDGLPNNRVLSWFEDLEGSIWIGTNGGVIRLRQSLFTTLTSNQGLVADYVRTVIEIDENRLLAGTNRGLSVIKNQHVDPSYNSTESISVLSLAKRHAGGIWVGTYQTGLHIWDEGKLTKVLDDKLGLPTNEIRAILEDSQGNLWLGTSLGLVKQTPDGKLQHFTKQTNGLHDDYVMALGEDEFGRIWVGTGLGAGYWQAGAFHPIDLSSQEGAQYVFGLYVEPDYIWFATDRGMVRYQHSDQSLGLVGRPQGLLIDKFFQIVKDDQQHFWLSSNRGIWKVNYQDAHAVAGGHQKNISFEHYDENDGMASSQANGGSNPAAIKSADGNIYFSTAGGVAFIHPDDLNQQSNMTLPLILESVSFDLQAINPEIDQQAPAGTNRISIAYVGLSYIMSQRLQYRTKLVGFDDEWVYQGAKATADYTNLPPGHYQFYVSARYPYAEWNDSKMLYEFTLEPLLWERKEVVVASLIVLILLIGAATRWQINILKRSELKLKEQVEEQTQALRLQSKMFEALSQEDALTGLANRRAFDANLKRLYEEAKANKQALYVAILDIDYFKSINDQYSHLVGDKALICFANILSELAISKDHVARWGGEEFTMLYLGSAPKQFFDTVHQHIKQHNYDHIEKGIKITASIGVAGGTQLKDYETTLKQADNALLKAKQSGRNRVEFYQETPSDPN